MLRSSVSAWNRTKYIYIYIYAFLSWIQAKEQSNTEAMSCTLSTEYIIHRHFTPGHNFVSWIPRLWLKTSKYIIIERWRKLLTSDRTKTCDKWKEQQMCASADLIESYQTHLPKQSTHTEQIPFQPSNYFYGCNIWHW